MSDRAGSPSQAELAAGGEAPTRRDFLTLTTAAFGLLGAGIVAWPMIDSMNPSADVLALSTVDVDLSPVQVGQRITATWRGKPIFIDRRTRQEVAEARAADHSPTLIDPATDASRVKRQPWLVVIGICTHLGCVPLGQKPGDPRGPYGGYFCPCHGSIYDTAGRVRHGPAPKNLYLPPYEFRSDTKLRIG
ncbi:ubiquinol-cytochrome c reductase iron-sulfur subunit [Tistlia consotensis]|uniref:Ubiquinol-cytochrome c reductase iron-sulfur subunit n=1 Tax=Tistlia consotensis USBA 355 TaxID=560819 RepID=A0A1Y6BYF6_9PROT|nr:ubiquinol-cytochrome c reductase iron-sulfur subunit [Tistlia consotensis]SMF36083.1 ubiquinol-cytochrome c reductase iron-sulfur subunit [Tistlia consotensis USBA 355]SNR71386.1 ubiquinol-cytochrome c reductase iron-sulfur subunit [Tistlia consotensis]